MGVRVEHVRYQRGELAQAQPAVAVGVILAQPIHHLGRSALHTWLGLGLGLRLGLELAWG